MQYAVHVRTTCRLCGSLAVKRFITFQNMPFTDAFVEAQDQGTEFVHDLSIYWCAHCSAVQTLHDVDVSRYYDDYRYTVSASAFATRFMQQLAQEALRRFGHGPGTRVLEVGSGDGSQLRAFQDLGAQVLGFEPSRTLSEISRVSGVPVIHGLFDAEALPLVPAEMQPVDIVLLTYPFDHLPDPGALLRSMRSILHPARGVLVLEIHDLEKILERHEICLFEHEHTIYLREGTLTTLLARHGYRVVTAQVLPDALRRANSLLVAAAVTDSVYADEVRGDPRRTQDLESWETYAAFGREVANTRETLRQYVQAKVAQGKTLAGYGAGGRGVMTLAMAGLTGAEIRYVCDRNPSLHGLLTPVSHVPLVGLDHLQREPVDEVLVFSYGYLEEIRTDLSWYLRQGGRLVSLLEIL